MEVLSRCWLGSRVIGLVVLVSLVGESCEWMPTRTDLLATANCFFRKSGDVNVCLVEQVDKVYRVQRAMFIDEAQSEIKRYELTHGRGKSENATDIASTLTDFISSGFNLYMDFVSDITGSDDKDEASDEETNALTDDDEDEEDEEEAPVEKVKSTKKKNNARSLGESRKKKKKKIHKLIALIKLIVAGAIIKAIIVTKLQILSFLLQVKFFFIALVGLILNVARFWIDWKYKKLEQKVIYYEHAQHQHHYDLGEEGGHYDEHPQESGGWWARSAKTYPAHDVAYSAHTRGDGEAAGASGVSGVSYNRQEIPQTLQQNTWRTSPGVQQSSSSWF